MGTKLDVSNSGLKVLMATETKGNAVNKTGKEDCEPAEKIANCPFCKGNHVKVMVNSSTGTIGWLNGVSVSGRTYRYYVRCNQCKARGPIANCWVPFSAEVGNLSLVESIVVRAYKKEKELAEGRAIWLWNQYSGK